MTALDQLADPQGEIRALLRRIRQVETRNPFAAASITRGEGLRIALGGGIRLEGVGTIVAGGLSLTAEQGGALLAGGAYIRASGGGQVGAGGTLIGGDGRISNASGVNSFNGGVAASGGVSGTDASFSGTLGAASAYVTGSTNVGGMYSRGAIASESTITGTRVRGTQGVDSPWKGNVTSVEAIGLWVESLAQAAQAAANAAQSTANGRVTQDQLQTLAQAMTNLASFVGQVATRVNQHQSDLESLGKPNRPPLVQG